MSSPSTLLFSCPHPLAPPLPTSPITKISFRHFNKHLICKPNTTSFTSPIPSFSSLGLSSSIFRRTLLLRPPAKSSYADVGVSNSQNPSTVGDLWNSLSELVMTRIEELDPVGVCKWAGIAAIGIGAARWMVNLVLSPFFWVYFSWSWMFWPWFVAVAVGACEVWCFSRYMRGEAGVYDQAAIVVSVVFWLTLVPPAFFNGFLEGWPWAFFGSYLYFFFLNVNVRKRLYGDLYVRPHDPKWDVNVPDWCRGLFCACVMVGHWLAAFEGPELHRIPGGLSNVGIWAVILTSIFMQYSAVYYLSKYSEKVVVPTAVVEFGAYRWVRHPIYASTMMLLLAYPVALRAPFSFLFMAAICVFYYNEKAKLEEALMIDEFEDHYIEYMSNVKYRFFRFIF